MIKAIKAWAIVNPKTKKPIFELGRYVIYKSKQKAQLMASAPFFKNKPKVFKAGILIITK